MIDMNVMGIQVEWEVGIPMFARFLESLQQGFLSKKI